ncbi:Uncharacterised protein [Streptococcus constellatus]|uniref:Uncharacterized protein n=1 Tax=Streptococcus constellatus TaxID=76860 RepID=A0A564S811_STRCV|nr:hypothetical protein [Streptococcus constellatus]VUW91267.1 Uncharacterised protein [Streptococcus constellatus]VUX08256.1 Uncharacterised protein [Streptococcus gordonii]
MIKKVKNNALLIAILVTLFSLGAKNIVSAAYIAEVVHTRYDVHLVMGGTTRTTYSWMNLYYHRGFKLNRIETLRRDYGINPGFLHIYHYSTY